MNKIWMHISICLCLLMTFTVTQGQNRCGSEYVEHLSALHNPNFIQQKEATERAIADAIRNPSLSLRNELYIPIVVHVVYNEDFERISDEQIASQIELLNADFSALLIPAGIPDEFANLYEDVGIRFCLAKNDPEGNPTNGITYNTTNIKNIGLKVDESGRKKVQHGFLGGADAWPTDKYLNIWVCRLDEFLGYATRPGGSFFSGEDGVVINYTNFGNIGTVNPKGPYNLGRTTTHEVGHYFGLLHLWGENANGCGDDLVEDTPQQGTPHYGCPNYPQLSCMNSNMFMNFMDYTDDKCMFMFTPGQGQRMRATLESTRNLLLNGENTHCDQFNDPIEGLAKRMKLLQSVVKDEVILVQDAGYKEVIHVTIYDMSGRELKKLVKISQQKIIIDLENEFAPGMYILNVRTKKEHFAFKFLIIK